ncbi:hypothetical protein L210DRAFT_220883 [Boletus edulis BED1]|uniref:Uncharacterized protein n=1 Tax=Boletus edulis BED1 TaxID=1328754 RepID=A0AAD4BS32_BOLED|nr:hypothetical protein L210DRAFT_220883 [Boletus edulis BED1]
MESTPTLIRLWHARQAHLLFAVRARMRHVLPIAVNITIFLFPLSDLSLHAMSSELSFCSNPPSESSSSLGAWI